MLRMKVLCLSLVLALPALAQTGPHGAHAMSDAKPAHAAVYNDATRLAALLRDAQTTVSLSAASWRTIANEANALANRIYGRTAGNRTARAAARDLRTHVREMRTAALKGDAAAARDHANQALPFAYTLIDWAK
jgi:hypothetical protein